MSSKRATVFLNQGIKLVLISQWYPCPPASFSRCVSCAFCAMHSCHWWFGTSHCTMGRVALPGLESAEWLNLLSLLLMPHFCSFCPLLCWERPSASVLCEGSSLTTHLTEETAAQILCHLIGWFEVVRALQLTLTQGRNTCSPVVLQSSN